jgi:membrane protease YdiL (CAAX protease family)
MSFAVDLGPPAPARTPDRPFGPIAALILGPLVFLGGVAIAAIASLFIVAGLDPLGTDTFLESFGTDFLPADAPGVQLFDGLLFFLSAPIPIAMIFGLAALRGDVRRNLAIGGSFPTRPLLVAAIFIAVSAAFETWLGSVFPYLRELFTLPTEPSALWLALIGAVIGAPIAEELIFRGFIFTAVRTRWGYPLALGLTSVLFAAMHFDPTGVYALLVLPSAFLLGWLREKTGGIAAPILVHATFNAIACAGLLLERAG